MFFFFIIWKQNSLKTLFSEKTVTSVIWAVLCSTISSYVLRFRTKMYCSFFRNIACSLFSDTGAMMPQHERRNLQNYKSRYSTKTRPSPLDIITVQVPKACSSRVTYPNFSLPNTNQQQVRTKKARNATAYPKCNCWDCATTTVSKP